MQSFCNPIASQESHLAGLLVSFGYNFAQHHEGKGWYDPEEGRVALENTAEAGSAMAQYYLGRIQLEDEGKIASDPIMARYWLKQAVDQGYWPTIELWEQKWGRNS